MGCTLSKTNKVSPSVMTPCTKRGRFTNLKLWVGKKRCALFQQKVRKNQVMPLNPSPEDCDPISPETHGTASCYTPTTTSRSSSSSSWITTVSDVSDESDSDKVQTAGPASNDRCRTRIIKKGSGSYQSNGAPSESSEDSYHGDFDSGEKSPILFSSPRGSPADRPNSNMGIIKMIMAKQGIDLDDEEAGRLMRVAEVEVAKIQKERQQRLESDPDDDDDDEWNVNLDGILRVTPIRPPTHDGKALIRAVQSDSFGEEEETKFANSTEELEAVINKTFKKYNLKMPEEEWKLEEKTYKDSDEELGDVIQQIFRRWNIEMPNEEQMPSTSRASTSAVTHAQSSNNRGGTAAADDTLRSRIRQARPKAAHGARTDPTGRGFELPGSAFQRKY